MRDNEEISFTSKIDWRSLKIGPESVLSPDKRKAASGEEVDDI
jgi:hypothetical protein